MCEYGFNKAELHTSLLPVYLIFNLLKNISFVHFLHAMYVERETNIYNISKVVFGLHFTICKILAFMYSSFSVLYMASQVSGMISPPFHQLLSIRGERHTIDF